MVDIARCGVSVRCGPEMLNQGLTGNMKSYTGELYTHISNVELTRIALRLYIQIGLYICFLSGLGQPELSQI